MRLPLTLSQAKIEAILKAGREQLPPEEFDELADLLVDLQVYGLTPWINSQLGELMTKIQWELPEELPEEWSEALQACDYAFLGAELKRMCYESELSPVGHKKLLCARLYRAKVPEVVAIMEPHIYREAGQPVTRLPQTGSIWASKLRGVKDRLEELHRVAPAEFYQRKRLIEQAIEERGRGRRKTMPDLTLDELNDLLKFTGRLYR